MSLVTEEKPAGTSVPVVNFALPNTVRGSFSGAFKKKLGLDITSAKGDGDPVYRILNQTGQATGQSIFIWKIVTIRLATNQDRSHFRRKS